VKLSVVYLVLMIVILTVVTGCATGTPQSTPALSSTLPPTAAASAVQNVTAQEAYSLVQNNRDNPDFIIIDVRTADEYNTGHIDRAVNIDVASPDFRSKINQLDKNKKYLVYCRSGVRSAQASGIMAELGFTSITNLLQGISQWIASGYPTVTS
jgi:rhodanese-related sulfurtransferase